MSAEEAARPRRRRRWPFVLAVLALLGGALLARLPRISALLISRSLTTAFGRPVSVGEVRFRWFPPEAEILDLRVLGRTAAEAPFLEVPRVLATPSLAPLWGRRLVLSRLRLESPRIRIHAYPDKGDDIPSFAKGRIGGAGLEVRVQRLVIDQGEFLLDHDRVPLDLDLPDFKGRLLRGRGGVLAGEMRFGPGSIRFGTAPPLDVSTDMQLEIDGPTITATAAHLRSTRTDLAYTGSVTLGSPVRGSFSLRGPVDLEVLDHHVMRTGFGIRGAAHYEGDLTVEGSRLRLEGRFEGTEGSFDGVAVPQYAGGVSWNEAGVRLQGMELSALGGGATLDLDIPPGRSTARLSGSLRGVDAEGLVRAIFDIGAPGIGAALSGPLEVRWPRGRFRDLSGTMGLDAEDRADGRTPLHGRFEWRADSGLQTIEKADLKTPVTHAILAGRIEADGRTEMSVDAESTDLQSSDGLLLRVRRALGSPEAQATGFGGAGTFQGRWGGTLHRPAFSGRFSGQDVTYLGVTWGRAEWAGTATPDEVGLHSLVVKRGRSELWLDGRAETGAYGEADTMELRARFRDWPAEDFAKALDWGMEVSGPISGEAQLGGRRSLPTGSIKALGTAGRYFRIPWSDLDLSAELRGAETRVSSGRASVGGGRVRFQGTSRTPGVYDGSLEMTDVDVADVLPGPAPGVGFGGRVSSSLTFQGTLERPRLSGQLRSTRLFLGDEGVGAVEVSFEGDGTGSVDLRGRCRSARVDVDVEGRVGAAAPFAADLRLTARQSSLDPFLRALAPRLPPSVGIVTTGEARVQGPLAQPRELVVQATASELEVLFPEYPIRNGAPLRFEVENGRLTVREFHLAGEGTDLRIEGDAGLSPEDPLRVEVRGEADLRALAALTQKLRGRGAARLSLEVSGTRVSPRAQGTLELEGGGLRVRGFPHGLEGVRGTLRFTESAAVLAGVTGTLAGGSMELQGQASYGAGRLSSFEIQSIGHGMTLRYPEGLRSLADADLRLFGDSERQWLTGTVDVRQALWSRRYDVASELLAEGRGGFEPGASLGEGVHLDVRVRAPGTLKVDNNLATLQARAELALSGTTESPVILGRAEIERGRVYFQGNTYVIRRGSIDFANPERIDPHFEIEAEARVRSYRVTLRVDGTLERVYPTLTSDPPLSALQILNLLAGADESAVASMTEAQTEQGRLAATGAATLAAGRLAEQVGLERGAERLFGLNRFSIDPALVRGANPSARLTVGKRLTSDLSVVYSVDLRGTGERLLSVEYNVSDRFSVLLTQSEVDGYGFDVRLRQSH